MRTRLAYILLWLLPGLLILGLMAYYYKQLNRSERHLARKLRYLSVSDNFRYGQKILPAIHAWRKPENPLLFKEFFTLGRGYVYQSDKEFSDYLKNFGPDARNTYLQAVRRVLLSPASEELKDRYRKGALLHLEPDAFISIPSNGLKRPRHEFYWVEAVDSDEGAFEWWQDKTPILQEAKDSGLIEDYRHLAFLAVAPESVTGRYERLKDEADEAVITIGLREQAASQGIDRRLFRHEEGRLEKSGWILKEPLTVAEQFSRWRELGVTNLLQNYIIPRENGGYWAVIRIDAGADQPRPLVSRKLLELNGTNDLPLVICEGALKMEVEEKLDALFKGIMQAWLLVFAVLFILQTIRQFFVYYLMGRGFVPEVMYRYFSPGTRAYLARNGYKSFTHVMTFEEVQRQRAKGLEIPEVMVMRVHQKRGNIRRIDRLDLEPGFKAICESGTVYLKRAYGKGMKELRREYINMRRMQRRGLKVPKILSYCEAQWKGYWCGYLMTANLDGMLPLDYWQTYVAPKLSEEERFKTVRSLTESLALTLRRSHRHGVFALQLFGKHIFFNPEKLEEGVTLIDVEKATCLGDFMLKVMRRFPIFWRHHYAKDLAFLNRYLFWEYWSLNERLRLFIRYCRRSRFRGAALRRITEKERKILLEANKISLRKGYGQYQRVGDVYYNVAKYAEMKLTLPAEFRDYIGFHSDENVTRKKGRTVVKMHSAGKTYYLKRHSGMSIKDAILEFLRHGRRMSNGRLEWKAMQICDSLGILNMPSRAMGEKFKGLREKTSFLLTEALPPGKTIEDHFKEGLRLSLKQKRLLISRIADIAHKLHSAGFVHKDFYLGHFYVVGDLQTKKYELHLLDLQRLAKGAKLLNRWSLKDMTALYFSAKPFMETGQITNADLMRLYLSYVRKPKLEVQDKKFIRKLFFKEARVASHTEKLLERRRKRGELDGLVK